MGLLKAEGGQEKEEIHHFVLVVGSFHVAV